MPSITARGRGKGRRLVNEINVVPYIDVMLVLLVIFMVTAPLLPPGAIELPSAGKSAAPPDTYIEVIVRADGDLRLRSVNRGDSEEVRITRRDLAATIAPLRAGADLPVVISADKAVRYEAVMDVMNELQRMNVSRVALMVKPGG
jgi:biopolymer transport protein TolR